MFELIIMTTSLIVANIATIMITVYKRAKKYNRPWQTVLKRIDKRTKPGYGRKQIHNKH